MNVIECKQLTKQFKGWKALDELNVTIEENKITGLIGRNGAGKTTFLKILAGLWKETSGTVHVFSEHPFNSLTVSANTIFIDDQMEFPSVLTLREILEQAGFFYENWDQQLAERLFDYFSFHPKQNHNSLSKGKKSTFNMILGLASHCPLTIFDEPATGMDASVRKDFYRALLKDYLKYPRTILISSHHLDEMEDILEDILLMQDGKKYLHMSVDDIKEYAIGLTGKREKLAGYLADLDVIFIDSAGIGNDYAVVRNTLTNALLEEMSLDGIKADAVSPSDLCVCLTNKTKGGIDDVFDKA